MTAVPFDVSAPLEPNSTRARSPDPGGRAAAARIKLRGKRAGEEPILHAGQRRFTAVCCVRVDDSPGRPSEPSASWPARPEPGELGPAWRRDIWRSRCFRLWDRLV